MIYIIIQDDNISASQDPNYFLTKYNFRSKIPDEQPISNKRILLSDVKENTRNICVLAICTGIGNMTPDENDLERRLVSCTDESAITFYITVWGKISKEISNYLPGM